jgi:hypothetical protein
MPVYDLMLGGIRLKVRDSDAEQATKILGKVRGSFWAPSPKVLLTHVMAGFLFSFSLAVLGFFVYLFLGPMDKNLIMSINGILFGVCSFAWCRRVAHSNSDWIYKWSGFRLKEASTVKIIMSMGIFGFVVGIYLILHHDFWFSVPTIVWSLLSPIVWVFFFVRFKP